MPTRRTPNNILANALRKHQVRVFQFATSLNGDVQQRVIGIRADLVRIVAQGDPTEPTRLGDRLNRIDAIAAGARKVVANEYRKIGAHSERELTELAEIDQSAVARIIQRTAGDRGIVTLPARRIERIVERAVVGGATMKEWWGRQAQDVVKRYRDQINQGMRAGESVGDLIQRVRGTAARRYQDGVIGGQTLAQAEAITRSSVMSVANDMRREEYKANSDVLSGWELAVTFDNRLCILCMSYANALYDHDGDPLPESPVKRRLPSDGLPLHFSCRCLAIPHIRGEEPADDVDFEAWFVDQPEADQVEILGKQWHAAWKSGELKDLRDRVDQRGRPIRLSDLRRKVEREAA